MSEQKSDKKFYSRQLAGGSLWRYQSGERGDFFAGNIDFGILGVSKIMIFQRSKKEGDGENMPDWNICTSYKEGDPLSNVGALWSKSFEKDGKKKKYLSGVLSAGIHGEYQVAVFTNEGEKRSDKSPEKTVRVSILRERTEGGQAGYSDQIDEDDVPF